MGDADDCKSKHRHPIIDPDTIDVVVSTKYIIENYLVLGESTFVFGPPKHLKTFLVLSWMLCLATGLHWFGHKVRQLKVLYIIGEGADAFMGRVKAWQIANKVPNLGENFRIVRRMVNLFDGSLKASIDDIKAQGFIPDVIVIDTLGRAMGGAKETTEDFNTIFRYIDEMMQDYLPGLTLVVVGHTRKADLTFRGPQVIPGDCDNIIYVERIGKELKTNVTCEFSRNASEFSNFGVTFGLRLVATDEGMQNFLTVDGVVGAFDTKADDKTADKNKDEELAYRTLFSFFQSNDTWTQHSIWFQTTKTARGDKGLGNTTFSDIIKSLVRKGRIRVNEEGLYQVVLGPAEPASSSPGDGRSSSSYSPTKEWGVGGVTGDTPRSTPGAGSSNKVWDEAASPQSCNDENKVVAGEAEELLKTVMGG